MLIGDEMAGLGSGLTFPSGLSSNMQDNPASGMSNLGMGENVPPHARSRTSVAMRRFRAGEMAMAAARMTAPMPLTAQVPVGRLVVQAQQQAAISRLRLQEDVAALDRYNKDVNQANDRATAALQIALVKDTAPNENHG